MKKRILNATMLFLIVFTVAFSMTVVNAAVHTIADIDLATFNTVTGKDSGTSAKAGDNWGISDGSSIKVYTEAIDGVGLKIKSNPSGGTTSNKRISTGIQPKVSGLAANSELVYTIEFKTPTQAAEGAVGGANLWFAFRPKSPDSYFNAFGLNVTQTAVKGRFMSSASTPSYDANKGNLDTGDDFTLAFDTDYKAEITLTPNSDNDNDYRYVIRLYTKNDSGEFNTTPSKTGVINKISWVSGFNKNTFSDFTDNTSSSRHTNIGMMVVGAKNTELDLAIVKRLTLKVVEPLEITTAPADGDKAVSLSGPFTLTADTPIVDISTSQIEISGGATVESATLSADKKTITMTFAGLEPETEYTVTVKDFKAEGYGDNLYTQTWSFTTQDPLSFTCTDALSVTNNFEVTVNFSSLDAAASNLVDLLLIKEIKLAEGMWWIDDVSVKTGNLVTGANGSVTIDGVAVENTDKTRIRVYVLDGINTMIPMSFETLIGE